MREKRFRKLSSSIDYFEVWDGVEEKGYTVDELMGMLNEQQDTISQLKEENEQLRKVCSHLKKENKSLIENIFDIYEKVKWVSR